MPILHLDYETRSTVDLRKTGVYPYAKHATTDVWCAAYAVDDGPVEMWLPGDPVPEPIVLQAVDRDWQVIAHNANFERAITTHVMPRHGWPDIPINRWRCTMAMGYAMSLPGSLENMAAALGLDTRKDASGHRQMLQMSKPRRIEPDGTIVWWDDDERKERLYAYCKQDVEVERELCKRLIPLRASEQTIWFLDQKINDRGMYVDEELCHAATGVVHVTQKKLNDRMRQVTGGEVSACTNVNELTAFVKRNGVPDVKSVDKPSVVKLLLRNDLPPTTRTALETRAEAAKASVAKITSLLAGCDDDGRHRGLFQFHAASTGRFGGRRFQPQNLVRSELEGFNLQLAIDCLGTGDVDTVELFFDKPLSVVANCVRSLVRAAPGHDLLCADFANIEGRVLVWLAGEDWKIDAYKAYDAGTGPDLYKVAYASSFGVGVDSVTPKQRQIGKVEELALGFGGGPSAFATMGPNYGVNIGEQYEQIVSVAKQWALEEAQEAWESYGHINRMDRNSWLAAEIIKRLWRRQHPNVVDMWARLDECAIAAVEHSGRFGAFQTHGVIYRKVGSFLFCQLPSGRALCYPYPTIRETETPWGTTKKTLFYKGIDSRKPGSGWTDLHTYGGKLCENIVQAIARDVLVGAMLRVELAGYPIVMHVHDEIVSEMAKGVGDLERFMGLMAGSPAWAGGLPIAVAGWREERYRK